MKSVKQSSALAMASSLLLAGGLAFQATAEAATAVYEPASQVLNISEVDVHIGGQVSTWSAALKLISASEPYVLQIVAANIMSPVGAADRATYFGDTEYVYLPDVQVNGGSFTARLKVVEGTTSQFEVDQLIDNNTTACPDFSFAGPIAGSCVLAGTISQDITLTRNFLWLLSGGVFIGGDNTNSAKLTVNPGTEITGQSGADFLWIRRGSQVHSEGTPAMPVVMTGPSKVAAGEWGGMVVSGNAPVNGCSEDVDPCELAFEAIATEFFGGNQPEDNSGVIKYTQINYAGFAVRPDEELNGLTLTGVGSGTLIDYVQVHKGLDDGVELFGGTAQMKHLVLTGAADDSLDWGLGWTGKAQFVLVQQEADDGDRGIEADNNGDNNDALPRSKPMLANMTLLGGATSSQGALLRRGTGANIYNAVFQGFGDQCLRIDGTPTYVNAGTIAAMTGELTIEDSYVNCATNFKDEVDQPFLVSDWFTAQPGNVEGDPMLNGYLPAPGSPLISGGNVVSDSFFTPAAYIGAFASEADDWTAEWTTPF